MSKYEVILFIFKPSLSNFPFSLMFVAVLPHLLKRNLTYLNVHSFRFFGVTVADLL